MMATLSRPVSNGPVVVSSNAARLATVTDRNCALAIWKRPLFGELPDMIAATDFDTVDDVLLPLKLPISVNSLALKLTAAGYGKAVADALARDIVDHASRLASIAAAETIIIRLEIVETDACRRFHADQVTYRLITTYHGQATQWRQANQPERIEQMQAGDVGIFKGRLLLDDPTVLHRSPPIEVTGEDRLVLVIDPADCTDTA